MLASLWSKMGAPFAITGGLAGWFLHTMFFRLKVKPEKGSSP
jgi:predicted membrane protein